MCAIKTVGVKELKDKLSSYLREVSAGVHLLVTDHNKVVAELHQPLLIQNMNSMNAVLFQWTKEGKIRVPASRRSKILPPEHFFPEGTALGDCRKRSKI